MPKKRVYLAGPISNCNDRQTHEWREEILSRWGRQYEFVDPSTFPSARSTPWEVVHTDLEGIRDADAVLANMWKESIGTAIGISHAALHGTPVFVVDGNRLDSRTIAYYAYAVVRTQDEAMRRIREFFRAEDALRRVVKRSGDEEPFRREKLLESIRAACKAAGADDLLPPTEILPVAISRLLQVKRGPGKGRVTSTAIRESVWDALRTLEADALRGDHFAGIRAGWEEHDRERRRPRLPDADPGGVKIHEKPLNVRVESNKSHASIWGVAIKDISQIPRDARRLFQEICRVDGIREIRITKKGNSRSRRASGVKAEIFAARAAHLIEGKCYDTGERGDIQMFQIHVHDPAAKEAIRRRLMDHLRDQNYLMITPADAAEDEGD